MCLGPAGRAAGAERARRRVRDSGGGGAQLHGARAVGVRAQELLLSGPAEGLPDFPVRPAARDGGLADDRGVRPATCASASRASTWRRTPASRCITGLPDSDRAAYLDFNRSGVPLVEIVTEPDLRSAEDAADCFARIREVVVAIGVSDGNMEEGSLRCDANVSVRPAGDDCARDQDGGQERQFVPVRAEGAGVRDRAAGGARWRGERVRQETRLWDSDRGETLSMRGKEEAHDYRYFPGAGSAAARRERRDGGRIARVAAGIAGRARGAVRRGYGLSAYDANVLVRLIDGARRLLRSRPWPPARRPRPPATGFRAKSGGSSRSSARKTWPACRFARAARRSSSRSSSAASSADPAPRACSTRCGPATNRRKRSLMTPKAWRRLATRRVLARLVAEVIAAHPDSVDADPRRAQQRAGLSGGAGHEGDAAKPTRKR